jgi:uncharacterized protein (TIGR02266 family)
MRKHDLQGEGGSFMAVGATRPNPGEGRERRTSRRAALLVQVDFVSQQAFALGRSQDISEGGLLVMCQETLEPGTQVEVRFVLPVSPQAVTIDTKAVVVRAQPGTSMGIEFVNLRPEAREAIARFVQSSRAS